MKILVVGATGNQGRAVVKHCLAGVHEVLALVRDPQTEAARGLARAGARLVQGDLNDHRTLRSALRGVEGLFSMQNFWQTGHLLEFRQGRALIEAARDEGVRHVVHSSAGMDVGAGSANMEVKAIIEFLVREAFPTALILRPIWFIESLNPSSFNLAHRTFDFFTAPDQPIAWVSVDDIGRVTARAFSAFDAYAGLTANFASASHTGPEFAQAINRHFGSDFSYHQFSKEELEQKIHQWRTTPEFTNELRANFSFIRDQGFRVDWEQQDRLLQPRRTLDGWAKSVVPLWGDFAG